MLTRRTRQSGQTVILYTLGLTVVCGTVGLVSDVGYLYYRKQNAQAAAQSAALASIKAAVTASGGTFTCGTGTGHVGCNSNYVCPSSISGYGSNNLEVACLYANKNGYTGSNVWLEANTGNIQGIHTSYYTVAHVKETLPLLFSAVLGRSSNLVAARAIAAYTPGGNGGCIYALDSNAADAGTLTMNGSATLTSGCGVYVDGPNANAANLNGGGVITVNGGNNVQIVGGFTCAGGATNCISPSPTIHANPTSDPLAGMPAPTDPGTCTSPTWNGHNGTFSNPSGGTIDICGDLSLNNNDNFTFPPGTYIFKNCNSSGNQGFSVQGTANVTGSGVFFYFTGSCGPQITGTGSVTLSAATSGTYNGILMYEDPNDTATSPKLAGGAGQILNGVVYMPNDNLTYAGGSNTGGSSNQALSLIAWQIKVTGNASYIQSGASSPYLSFSPGYAILE